MYDPENYESSHSPVCTAAAEIYPIFIRHMEWSQSEVLLDYGCGGGTTTATHLLPLAKKYHSKIHGVDISPKMIEFSRNKFPPDNGNELVFRVGNIMDRESALFRSQEKYDKVFAFHVLHWIKDYRCALSGLCNILKPGGFVGMSVVTKSHQFSLVQALGESQEWGKYTKGYSSYIPDWVEKQLDPETELCDSLKECGYEILQIQNKMMVHPDWSIECGMEWLFSLIPFLDRIPQALHPRLKTFTDDFLKKRFGIGSHQQYFNYTHQVVSFVARKPELQSKYKILQTYSAIE